MINDGGAERMVRNKNVEWWQIVAIIIMLVFVLLTFLFFFFIGNGNQMIEALNKATVKDAYSILTEAKAEFPDLAVTSYNQTDTTVDIEFKYYDTVLKDENVDFQKLNYEVKTFFEKYLEGHADDFINTGKRQLTLRFPNVVYSNVNPRGGFEYQTSLDYVSYRFSDISAGEFVEKLPAVKKATSLIFEENGVLDFGKETDFTVLKGIEGLKYIEIAKSNLTEEQRAALTKISEDNKIELNIKDE